MTLYTTNQIAAMIGMTRDGVHKRINRMGLIGVQIGKTRGFSPDQVKQIREYVPYSRSDMRMSSKPRPG